MALIVIFDEGATPQKVFAVHPSANTPDWEGRSDVLINPDLSAVDGIVDVDYWKVVAGQVVPFTAQEIADQDAADAAEVDTNTRSGGKGYFNGQTPEGLAFRAFADIVKDEINILRAQHGLADRTLAQLKSAIQSRIDSGDVDE